MQNWGLKYIVDLSSLWRPPALLALLTANSNPKPRASLASHKGDHIHCFLQQHRDMQVDVQMLWERSLDFFSLFLSMPFRTGFLQKKKCQPYAIGLRIRA